MQEQIHDLDAFGPESEKAGTVGWFFRALVFTLALGALAGAGYALGRGAWTIPGPIATHIPEPLSRWLPVSGAAAASFGPPSELKGYTFEVVKPEIKQDDGVVVVRLVSKADGRPISDAIIFARRLDMAPEGMATMTSPLDPVPATAPGLYAFKADLAMEGSWRLSLAAKVQGEIGTVQNRLIFKAVQ